MTREEAIKIVKEFINGTCLHLVDQEALETLIPELAENEDERIIRLLRELGSLDVAKELYEEYNLSYTDVLYWLEKQKECVSNNFDDVWNEEDCEEIIAEGQKLTPRFKELLKEVCHAWYDRGVKLEKQKEDEGYEAIPVESTLEYKLGFKAGKESEKQKDASKAIEAVERIDKYIDENLANAHDMKDSNPDKKYYRGWDDALGEMSRILQDVYSVENQKEQKGETLRDFIDNFPYSAEQEEQKPSIFPHGLGEVHWNPIPSVKKELMKKAAEKLSKEEYVKKFKALCGLYEIKLPNREYDIYGLCEDLHKLFGDIQKPAEWSHEDDNHFHSIYHYLRFLKEDSENEFVKNDIEKNINWFCRLYQTSPKQDKQEWSEKDERIRNQLIYDVEHHKKEGLISAKQNKATKTLYNGIEECYDEKIAWLKSLPLNLKKKNEDVAKLCSNEWSEEDETRLTNILIMLKEYVIHHYSKDDVYKSVDWLENRVKFLRSQPKQEWSEEDENIFNDILVDMADRREMFKSNGEIEFAEDTQKKIDWLSSHLSNFQSSYPQQKSAEWSEEDKQMLLTVICDLKRHDNDAYVAEIKWLNRLDERFSPQPKQEWSGDYDEENLQTRFAFYTYKDDPNVLYLSNVFVEETSRNHGFGTRILKAAEKVAETIGATAIRLKVKQDSPANTWYRKNGYVYMAFEDGYDWLEKNLEYMKSNKQEWSEEDKEIIYSLRSFLIQAEQSGRYGSIQIAQIEQCLNWLKSLRPQYHGDVTMTEAYKMGKEAGEASHWKPTEHQMTILKAVKEYVGKGSGYWGEGLGSLIDDLEKLT